MPPKRGRGQAQGVRGRGRGSPKAKAQAAATSPKKPGLKPADTAAAAEDTLSQDAVADELLSQEAGDVAGADRPQNAEEAAVIEEPKDLDETDTKANLPMDLKQTDDENKAANVSQEPSTSEVAVSELPENTNAKQKDESALSHVIDLTESEEKMDLSDAGAQVHVKDVVTNDDDVIIIDAENQDKEAVDETLKEGDNSGSLWSLRVCPIQFQGMLQNKQNFNQIRAKSLHFELRISQRLRIKKPKELVGKADAPWLPSEPPYSILLPEATAGLLELKVIDKAVPDVINLISTCKFPPNVRVRFELTKIAKEEARTSPFKEEDTLTKEAEDENIEEKKEGDTKEEKKEGDVKEEKMEGNIKDILQVNFNKFFPLSPFQEVFLKHPKGHVKQEEDDYIFLTNVPDQLPDSILVAIMNAEMKERKLGENNTGTAKFKVPENLVAEEYMSRFDGILVNSHMVEISTVLGTLTDVRKIRFEKFQLKREETRKRKLEEIEGKYSGAPVAKRRLGYNQRTRNANRQGGRGRQQQGFAGTRGRGQGNAGRQRQQQYPLNRQQAGNRNPQMVRPGNRNPQMVRPGNRNPQMVRPGNRNPQMVRPGNRNPQMVRPGNRNQQMMDRPGRFMMGRPGQGSPNQSYRGQSNDRDRGQQRMRDNMRPRPLMGIGFDVEREPEPVQTHMMADIQAQLLEKQRELEYLQNQARIQMAMIEQKEMAAAHYQHQMQQFSPGGQPSYQEWQPNRPPNRQPNRPPNRQPNRAPNRQPNRPPNRQPNRPPNRQPNQQQNRPRNRNTRR